MHMAASSTAVPHPDHRRGDRAASAGSNSTDADSTEAEALRTGRDLLRATERYAFDSRGRSWMHLLSTV